MTAVKTDVLVYAHWFGMNEPIKIGVLSAQEVRGSIVWSFNFEKNWLKQNPNVFLDPDLMSFTGNQYVSGLKTIFGMFGDSMPDTWGRTLLKKREVLFQEPGKTPKRLTELDFLLGVFDESRMGGLRFKLDEEGPFLDNDVLHSIPPIANVRELEFAANMVETEDDIESVRKWLQILLAPGSSLGGSRPKSTVIDENGDLWIAKFPSRLDTIDKGAWDYLAWKLAKDAGIQVPMARLEKLSERHHTFFSKRFDREGADRVHFASAMTMTGHVEIELRNQPASYLELAEFIQFHGASPETDLKELWRRIVFTIAISNTDDHLRNHGFILSDKGWRLAPAYDMNPSIDKNGLALNINLESNALDFELVKSVGEYFNLNKSEMELILNEVLNAVSNWEKEAVEIGISRVQREMMSLAFKLK